MKETSCLGQGCGTCTVCKLYGDLFKARTENTRLAAALSDAATSLETAASWKREGEVVDAYFEMKAFSHSRATVARAALTPPMPLLGRGEGEGMGLESPSVPPAPPGIQAKGGESRSSVRVFSLLMEDKLRENDHKGGWQSDTVGALFSRLIEEANELGAVLAVWRAGTSVADIVTVGREAADVANFAMMIADNCGALVERNTRPAPAPSLTAVACRGCGALAGEPCRDRPGEWKIHPDDCHDERIDDLRTLLTERATESCT